jgi:dihydroflavonol-4-reductase
VSLTLVTGASGFLGWHVAKILTEQGHKVRALCRPTSALRELAVEKITGDLRDPASLARAVDGCERVYHVAADYRLWSRNPGDLYAANVEGTRNLLDAALRAGVQRIVYTSTVGCIGMPPNKEGDETTPVSIADMTGHYKRSKWLAEQVALEKSRVGAPIVIVNPTAPIGDHDWKPTPTGKIIVDFLADRLPAFVDTGLNLVDARDAALGHILAAEKGRLGERYILGCENLTLEHILQRLGKIANKPAPKVKLPYAVAYAAGVVSTGVARITGKEPRVPMEGVRMARKKMFVSHAKATRELGFQPGTVDAALQRAVHWFKESGRC